MSVLAPSIPEDHATSSFPSSDGQAHPRPPKAPPLTSMPSTPGPVVPGGYPRNSGVFAGNQWDHSQNGSSGTGTGAGLFATARTYLPPGMASYFPDVPASSTSTSPAPPTSTTPPLLNTDGSTASDFSTRAAYAASDSWSRGARAGAGTPTPVPSEYTYTAAQQQRTQPQQAEEGAVQWDEGEEGQEEKPGVRPRATSGLVPSHPGVGAAAAAPSTLPASPASPVSPVSTPTPSPPTSSAVTTPSTAPSSPASHSPTSIDASFWASPKSPPKAKANANSGRSKAKAHGGSGFLRFGFGGARSASAASDSSSPSANLPAPNSELDSTPSNAAPSSSPSSTANSANSPAPDSELTDADTNGTPHTKHTPAHTHKPSLLRTLRGEATVLAGRVRRDPGRVERGRRMIDG
ncbi:hypothetical protein B0H11DRAFT_1955224 [Mycena galericulata]|nr:hypothetical protein B0H11DRAFT_1955224 [Mycena galericulata]